MIADNSICSWTQETSDANESIPDYRNSIEPHRLPQSSATAEMSRRKHDASPALAVGHQHQQFTDLIKQEQLEQAGNKKQRTSPAAAASSTPAARGPSLNFSIESIMNNSSTDHHHHHQDQQFAATTNSSGAHKSRRHHEGDKSIRSAMKKRRFDSRSPSPSAAAPGDNDDDDEVCSQRTSLSGNSNLTCADSSRSSEASPASSRASTPISPGCNSINLVNGEEDEDATSAPLDKLYKPNDSQLGEQQVNSSSHQHSSQSSEKSEQPQIGAANQSAAAARNNHNAQQPQQQQKSSGGKSRNSSGSGGSGSWSKERSAGGSTNHLLRQPVCTDQRLSPFECHLDNLDLWHRFHPLDTEMIITKQGRRMFPPVRVNFTLNEQLAASVQLNPRDKYQVLMDILPYDNKRYRYAYHKSSWQQAGKADPPSPTKLFLHPDGPFTLDQLKRQVISFEKIKLTNNDANKHGYIVLNSMHKYQPRIHLVLWRGRESQNLANSPIVLLEQEQHKTFIFSETIFTAVTAYQNHSITKLKIDSNPFAKGFRDSSRLTDLELESMQDLITADGQCPFSPPRAPPAGFPHFLFAAAAAQQQHSMAVGGQSKMGGEDPASALLRERTIMALDSFLQQQQQHQIHSSSSPHSPASTVNRQPAPGPMSSSSGPVGQHIQFSGPMGHHHAPPPPLSSSGGAAHGIHSSPISTISGRQANSPPPFGAGGSFLGPPSLPPATQAGLQQPHALPPPPAYSHPSHHQLPGPLPHALGQQQQLEQFLLQQQHFAAAMAAAMAVSNANGHPFQHLFAQMGGAPTTGASTTTSASCPMTNVGPALGPLSHRPSPSSAGPPLQNQSGSSSPTNSSTPQLANNGRHQSPTIEQHQQASPIGAAKSAARQQAEQLSMLSSQFAGNPNALAFLGPPLGGASDGRGAPPPPPPPYGYHAPAHSLQAMMQHHHQQQMAAMSMQKRLDQQQQQSAKIQDKK